MFKSWEKADFVIFAKNPLKIAPEKINKRISIYKYNVIKENILALLKESELTHTELMEQLYSNIKDSFEGGIQWYGEVVKLDLEARKIIEHTTTKPEKYRMKKKKR
jgi:hypothetical protein